MVPWHVDGAVKNILEDLEPGRHTFIPVNVRRNGSDKPERDFYIVHVTTAINAVVMEDTKFADGIGKYTQYQGRVLAAQISTVLPKIVVRKQPIIGHHLWRCGIGKWGGGDPMAYDYFCSDEFAQRVRHMKATSVDIYVPQYEQTATEINTSLVEFYECEIR